MLRAAPAFQLYARDEYTGAADLSAAEFGAYIRGLCWSWDNGPLPLDSDRRRRLMAVEQSEWPATWSVLAVRFWVETPAGWVNTRLEEQRREHAAYRQMQSAKGARGGRPSKADGKPGESRGLLPPKADGKPGESRGLLPPKADGKPGESPEKALRSPNSDLRSSHFDLPSGDHEQDRSKAPPSLGDDDATFNLACVLADEVVKDCDVKSVRDIGERKALLLQLAADRKIQLDPGMAIKAIDAVEAKKKKALARVTASDPRKRLSA